MTHEQRKPEPVPFYQRPAVHEAIRRAEQARKVRPS